VPATSQAVGIGEWNNRKHECQDADIFIFARFIQRLNIPKIVQKAGLPVSKMIPASGIFYPFWHSNLLGPNAMPIWAILPLIPSWDFLRDSMYCRNARP